MWILYLAIGICIALIAIVLFLIAPKKRRSTSPFDSTLYAHRGLHNSSCPENSLSAFQAAKEAGFGVELDVRFTADKQVVVFHDDTLTRMCGEHRRAYSFTQRCAGHTGQYRYSVRNQAFPFVRGYYIVRRNVRSFGKAQSEILH